MEQQQQPPPPPSSFHQTAVPQSHQQIHQTHQERKPTEALSTATSSTSSSSSLHTTTTTTTTPCAESTSTSTSSITSNQNVPPTTPTKQNQNADPNKKLTPITKSAQRYSLSQPPHENNNHNQNNMSIIDLTDDISPSPSPSDSKIVLKAPTSPVAEVGSTRATTSTSTSSSSSSSSFPSLPTTTSHVKPEKNLGFSTALQNKNNTNNIKTTTNNNFNVSDLVDRKPNITTQTQNYIQNSHLPDLKPDIKPKPEISVTPSTSSSAINLLNMVDDDDDNDDDDIVVTSYQEPEVTILQSQIVCLGQLDTLCLILYPLSALTLPPNSTESPVLPATLRRSRATGKDVIKVSYIDQSTGKESDSFGVVEHRHGDVVGALWDRNLIDHLSATIIRVSGPRPMMLPLHLLLFCQKSNASMIATEFALRQLYLKHPPNYNPSDHDNAPLQVPTPEEMHSYRNGAYFQQRQQQQLQLQQQQQQQQRPPIQLPFTAPSYPRPIAPYGPNSNGFPSHFTAAGLPPTNISNYQSPYYRNPDQERQQVEEMYKQLRSGVDLEEVEPSPLITTQMYPYQKQALAFLLHRERYLSMVDVNKAKSKEEQDTLFALWKPNRDSIGNRQYWRNVITSKFIDGSSLPPQIHAAIIADDMGLGKTLVIISLIVTSRDLAIRFQTNEAGAKADARKNKVNSSNNSGKRSNNSLLVLDDDDDIDDDVAAGGSGRSSSPASSSPAAPSPRPRASFVGGRKKATSSSTSTSTSSPTTTTTASSSAAATSSSTPTISRTASSSGTKNTINNKLMDLTPKKDASGYVTSRATLVVCPLSTVRNWETQIRDHTSDSSGTKLKVYIYHGQGRTGDPVVLGNNDIVITTYGTMASEWSRSPTALRELELKETKTPKDVERIRKRKKMSKPSILHEVEWFRIVLDEAHMIKEHTTVQAKACCDLEARNRICLTGTPVQNTLNDLFSLFKFMKLEPFTDRAEWTHYIGTPVKHGDPLGTSRLQLVMRAFCLRRTKETKQENGEPILKLPPKTINMRYIELDEKELKTYTSYHSKYKKAFIEMVKTNTVMKNYIHILEEILRLRQICCEIQLVKEAEKRKHQKQIELGLIDPNDELEDNDDDDNDNDNDNNNNDACGLRLGNSMLDDLNNDTSEGFDNSKALQTYSLMRDTGSAICNKCSITFNTPTDDEVLDKDDSMDEDEQGNATTSSKRSSKRAKTNSGTTTPTDEPQPVITKCLHIFCRDCFQSLPPPIKNDPLAAANNNDLVVCEICQDTLNRQADAVDISEAKRSTSLYNKSESFSNNANYVPGTKVRTVVNDIMPFSACNPYSENYNEHAYVPEGFKVPVKHVVFSQWTSLLDRIASVLDTCRIKHCRLDGSMGRDDRAVSLDKFNDDNSVEVLLISIKAGGVGLNLTRAQRIYFMEPNWNPAVEHQAQDRIHRLGQLNPVEAIRYIIRNTVEENMLKLQDDKIELAAKSLTQTRSKKEMQAQRYRELRTLFGDVPQSSSSSSSNTQEQQQQPQQQQQQQNGQ